jgi:hypothetical protein
VQIQVSGTNPVNIDLEMEGSSTSSFSVFSVEKNTNLHLNLTLYEATELMHKLQELVLTQMEKASAETGGYSKFN